MTNNINTKKHTDINKLVWIEKILPEFIRPYAYVMRLDRPIGVWLLLLPALWSISLSSGGILRMGQSEYVTIILFIIGAIIMRGAGCIINDIWDRNLDQRVERTKLRPIASGEIGLKQSLAFLALLLFLGLIILLQFNKITIILGFLTIPLIISYPLMKRITWWPQAFLGITFNFGALMGCNPSEFLPAFVWPLYIGGIFWTLGYDTIYAHQDKEDDIMAGIKSTARLFGKHSKVWVSMFFVLAFLFIALAIIYTGADGLRPFAFLIPATGLHFIWQIIKWNPDDPQSSLYIFKSNKIAGILVLLTCL